MDHASLDEAGRFYDRMTALYLAVGGDNAHMGYWDTEDDDASLAEAQERMTGVMIRRIQADSGQQVLDVGCGVGGPGIRLARETGCRVVGITVSQTQLNHATRLAEREHVANRVRFLLVDAMKLPFGEGSFDAAWAFESLFHMPDRLQVLREVARVLRAGGRLVLTDCVEKAPCTPIEQRVIEHALQVRSLALLPQYPRLFSMAGFQIEEITDISAHTRKSVTGMWDALRKNRESLERTYGTAFIQVLAKSWPLFEAIFTKKIGVMLAVGRKSDDAHARDTDAVSRHVSFG